MWDVPLNTVVTTDWPPHTLQKGVYIHYLFFFQILCDCGYCSILIYSTLQLFNCKMLSCALFSMNPNKKNDIIISQMQKSFSVQLFTPDCCCHQYLTNFFYMNEAILRNTLTHLHTASLSLMGLFIHRGRHRSLYIFNEVNEGYTVEERSLLLPYSIRLPVWSPAVSWWTEFAGLYVHVFTESTPTSSNSSTALSWPWMWQTWLSVCFSGPAVDWPTLISPTNCCDWP